MAEQETMESLKRELAELKQQVTALRGGVCTAIGALSIGLREIPDYKPELMDDFIIHTLKHGWPLEGIPDTEINEEYFSAPLRFLLQQHDQAREFFREERNRKK